MVSEITAQELARRRAAGEPLLLLDVRQPEEHAMVALRDDVLIPMNELPQRWGELKPPADGPVVVYCHHGVRSWMAANFLAQCGLREVLSLAGGIEAWSREVDPSVPRY